MADNYLENQMEKYRAGKLASGKTRTVVRSRREGELRVMYPKMRVFVADGLTETGKAIIKAFRGVDARVAFAGNDKLSGTDLANKTGGRFIPADAAAALHDACKAWGGVDIVITEGDIVELSKKIVSGKIFRISRESDIGNGAGSIIVSPGSGTAESTANLLLFLSHPDNSSLAVSRVQILPSSE